MKVVKTILAYIIALVFAVSILGLILINIASSKILNENYILAKLDEQNYYDEVLIDVKSNFENYIYQSGLAVEVLNDLVTKEQIEKDTKIILNNIYDGSDEEIDTKVISEKLHQNIKESLNRKITNSEQTKIDDFVKTICKEYENTISNTKYKTQVNSVLKKVNEYIDISKKAVYVIAGMSLILICILNVKKIYWIFAGIGIAFLVDGLILLIVKKYIFKKVNVYGITIMGEAVSKVLKEVLTDIFSTIVKYGYLLLISGIVLIIIYGVVNSIIQYNKIKEQYTPEN